VLSSGHGSPTMSNVMDDSVDPSNDPKSVTFGQLVRHSALELILTCFMLFGVTSIVRWVIGPSLISRTFPEIQVELLVVGASVAILIAGLILSPPGRATGGHMNPAISLAMWRFGVFPGAGVVPYIIAQLLGSVLGVLVARAAWGPVVAEPLVAYAVGWSGAELFVAETLSMAFIVLLVGVCLAAPRLAPFVPWIVGVAIGTAIATLGTSTGGSVNPARQFGPAALSGQTRFLWCICSRQWWVRCSRHGSERRSSATDPYSHQTMRHSPRRQPVVKLKDGCVKANEWARSRHRVRCGRAIN
jgi:glycerol uptake facilitator-like aquaporin